METPAVPLRHLVIVLGDQLDLQSSAFDGFDPAQDQVWMAEVMEESTHIPSSQMRSAVFLAAMRAFATALRQAGRPLHYTQLDDAHNRGSLETQLRADIATRRPQRLILTEPGDWRVRALLRQVALDVGLPLDERSDRHFLCSVPQFEAHAQGRKQLRMEFFYREMRRRHQVLLDSGGLPLGGAWNFDADNRQPFGAQGPGWLPQPRAFAPDGPTRAVLDLVRDRLGQQAGSAQAFDWPITRAQALVALDDFITHRLPLFGPHQDAIWPGEPWLYHSRLSAALNLKLLHPAEVVAAAEAAHHAGAVPLASAEGFIRQILGWREYVRGIYWTRMPAYAQGNALDAQLDLPAAYWGAPTDMACLRDAVGQTLRLGYAHHIQRLMVTGLYALLLGVVPQQVHAWYLGVYVDAVEWVELPNTLGMSQYADGGVMASKPYIASGQYLKRMSPSCRSCRFNPALRTGDSACPLTTLYWDFLMRHHSLLVRNPRLAPALKNLERLDAEERRVIRIQAEAIRTHPP